jgi:hypothetical protein
MPDNIDGLLSSFGVDPNSGSQPDATETDNSTADADTASDVNESESIENTETVDEQAPAEDTDSVQRQLEAENANKAFAAMRAENSKYKKLLNTLMRGSNFNGDEQAFMDLLTNESYKQQAKLQGMAANPEILKKIDQQEEQIKQLTESQRDQALMIGLKTLQQSHNLSGKEVEMFVQRAIENRIDLLAPGVNFDTLYKGMFFDDIVKKQIEEERQKWIKQSNKSVNAATPDGKSGKQDPAKTDVKTMTELNSLLNTVSKDLSK